MTPLIVILVLVVIVVGVAGPLMRRSRRDWQATREYHRALDTLGQLNESGPAVEQESPAADRPETDVALPGPLRRARELQANGTRGDKDRDKAARRGVEAGPGLRSGSPEPADAVESGPGLEAGSVPDPSHAVWPERRALPDVGAIPSNGTRGIPANGNGAHPEATDAPKQEGQERPGGQESGRPAQGKRQPLVLFGAEGQPPGRNPALVPAGASVLVRPAHLRRRRHRRGQKALVSTAAAVVVVGAAVGAVEATGGFGQLGIGGNGGSPAPIALKRHSVHPVSPSTTTIPPTTTVPPAPTTTLPPFSLVSNTNGTAMYQVSGPGTVVLSAQGSCWVDAHQTNAAGSSIYTAVMSPGQSETLHTPVWIRLGNPASVTVSVNGQPLPSTVAPAGEPYNYQLT